MEVRVSLLSAYAEVEGKHVAIRNRGAAFDGALRTLALGALRSEIVPLASTQIQERHFSVEAGTERLVVDLLPDDSPGEVWMNLYHCESPGLCTARYSEGVPHSFSAGGDGHTSGRNRSVVVDMPKAGKWKLVISRHGSGAGSAELRQLHLHPKYGLLASADMQQAREVGAEWQAPFQVWKRAAVPAEHRLVMLLDVQAAGIAGGPPASVLLKMVPLE